MKKLLSVLFLSSLCYAGNAQDKQQSDDGWKITGQLQCRTELDGRDFSIVTYPVSFTSMRTRIGVEKTFLKDLSLFVQFQDSRMWGQEKGTTNDIDNVDLHQVYAIVKNIFNQPLYAQAGRFEIQYGSQRLFGSNQWHYASRAADGVRIGFKTDDFWVDAFGMTQVLFKNFAAATVPNAYPYPAAADTSYNLYGFWGNVKLFTGSSLDVFGYNEVDRRKDELDRKLKDTTFAGKRMVDMSRYTFGINYNLKVENFSTLLEAAYQTGFATNGNKINKKDTYIDYTEQKTSSYALALRLQYNMEPFTASINAEMMSGTQGADTAKFLHDINTFENAYATKHQLFGYMDYFSNMEAGTRSLGVNDFYLRLSYQPKESPFYVQLDVHHFMSNQKGILADKSLSDALGQEIDWILKYDIVKGNSIEWGGGVFLPGNLMKDIYSVKQGTTTVTRQDPAFWMYLMLRVSI